MPRGSSYYTLRIPDEPWGFRPSRSDPASRRTAVGEPHIVVGVLVGTTAESPTSPTTLFDTDCQVLATTEQVWIVVDPDIFNRL